MKISFKRTWLMFMALTGIILFSRSTAVIAQSCGEADAGDDVIVAEKYVIQLNGSSTFTDPVSYHWDQIEGSPTVTLSDPDVADPIFTSPNVDEDGAGLTFQLTVTATSGGCEGESAIDEVMVGVVELPVPEDYEEDDKFCFISSISRRD